MRIIRHTAGIRDEVRGAAVAIGNFDGVHRGHQAVIDAARKAARSLDTSLAVVTFEPHPRRFFRPDDPPFQLSPLRSRVRQFRALGVDTLMIIHFDAQVSRASAEQFVDHVLVKGLAARHVAVGYDFVFGKDRHGDVALLRRIADKVGFGITEVSPVTVEGGAEVYSSTAIRGHLRAGDPAQAARLLGRCWEIEGRVQKGDQRGHRIGFPTANLALDEYMQPALGVYAVWAGIEHHGETDWHMGVANIGSRPTFDGQTVTVETHIFDFAEDIYGMILRVALVDYIRPERKFDEISQLREQIARDAARAQLLLEGVADDDILAPPDRANP
jgi:riboflavin kinase / FMN adenylyltransferase